MPNKAFKSFHYKDTITKDLIFGVVYKFQYGLRNESYYGESIRHLDITSGEHKAVSPLNGKSNHQITVLLVIIYSIFTFFSNF